MVDGSKIVPRFLNGGGQLSSTDPPVRHRLLEFSTGHIRLVFSGSQELRLHYVCTRKFAAAARSAYGVNF
jgi:hypothetical protein